MSNRIALVSRGLRAKAGCQILGCSESTFWKLAKLDPKFPKKRALSPRVSVWDEVELLSYRDSKVVEKVDA